MSNIQSIISSKVRQKISVHNENIKNGVSVVFKTKCESKCKNELFLKYLFPANTRNYVSLLRIFDKILT